MAYIVVGCGRVGAEVAQRLHQRGHAVAVIDQEPAAFQNLNPGFKGRLLEGVDCCPGPRTISADGSSASALREVLRDRNQRLLPWQGC